MFEPRDTPRVFALPPGADFAARLVDGLRDRSDDLSTTTLFLNTARMQRRVREAFDAGPARLLPRLRLITDFAQDAPMSPISGLRRRLELAAAIQQLIAAQPDLAPSTALFALSDSLAGLLDEMQGEGVTPADLSGLDVSDLSGHWQRAQAFLNVLTPYFALEEGADPQARLRYMANALSKEWHSDPPQHPIIIAGSTGSRGATAILMQAVARLPQGAVVLPGFDADMPARVWDQLSDAMTSEDHPQFRFHALMRDLEIGPGDILPWDSVGVTDPARNRLISLSLRPAPVTDEWLQEGPKLGDLLSATKGMTLVEAPDPRQEAEAIALGLRQAVEDGRTAALITPDRTLTRAVAAALDRWDIVPDDSAGVPLPLSPPGRLLRHVADQMGQRMTVEDLLVLLKHPLTHGADDRGTHLLRTRRLELHLRRQGPPYPTAESLRSWAAEQVARDDGAMVWADWLAGILDGLSDTQPGALSILIDLHLSLTERLSAGPKSEGAGPLYDEAAGREAARICAKLRQEADGRLDLTPRDYAALFSGVLNEAVVRDRDAGHPQVLIWGTLEARAGGAELVILGGLNDGIWPAPPSPDPWLNRQMRVDAGLLLPDRQIGLSAHDYQQAACAPEVWLTRARKTAEAETIPSRWLNRLTNLLSGLPAQQGDDALEAMRARGQTWLRQAQMLNAPEDQTPAAPRPAPRPPVKSRPTELSVTQVKTLIRDPYAIYARDVLGLKKLDPLRATADAPLRGTIIHSIMERMVSEAVLPDDSDAFDRLLQIADEEFAEQCPWPTIRLHWRTRFAQVLPHFLEEEGARRKAADPVTVEAAGRIAVAPTQVTLKARADRIDQRPDGGAMIYDYKTGAAPSPDQQKNFDKQLLLQAAMLKRGAYAGLPRMDVTGAAFIGLGAQPKTVPAPFDKEGPDEAWDSFVKLLQSYEQAEQGYLARRAMFSEDSESDYDHLSRFGEWSTSDEPSPEDLT